MTKKKKQMVTSLRVDSDIWKEAKIEAIKHDLTLAELVDEALKEWIQKRKQKEVERNE